MMANTLGGVWTYAVELCRALGQRGIEIALATLGARLNRTQREEIALLPNVKIFESTFKLEWMDEPRVDVQRAGEWLLEIEDSFNPDIVHLNSFSPGAFPWHAPKIVVGHSCVLSWWRAVHGSEAPAEWDEYRESVLAGLHGTDLVIAPSQAMLDALSEHYGPFKASQVIYNGRRLPDLKTGHKHDFIFTTGRLWDEGKNIFRLAEIAPQLPWPIFVAGEAVDPQGREIIHEHVHYAGKLSPDEMFSYLERAAIFALPARYEPFGLAVLEAALAGCALVLGDIPSAREIWGDAALFVNPEDPAALAQTIQELIAHPAELARMAAKARQAAKYYTPEKMADEYLAAYCSIMREPNLQQDIKKLRYADSPISLHAFV